MQNTAPLRCIVEEMYKYGQELSWWTDAELLKSEEP